MNMSQIKSTFAKKVILKVILALLIVWSGYYIFSKYNAYTLNRYVLTPAYMHNNKNVTSILKNIYIKNYLVKTFSNHYVDQYDFRKVEKVMGTYKNLIWRGGAVSKDSNYSIILFIGVASFSNGDILVESILSKSKDNRYTLKRIDLKSCLNDNLQLLFPLDLRLKSDKCLDLNLDLVNHDRSFESKFHDFTYKVFQQGNIKAIKHFIKADEYNDWSIKGMPYKSKSL